MIFTERSSEVQTEKFFVFICIANRVNSFHYSFCYRNLIPGTEYLLQSMLFCSKAKEKPWKNNIIQKVPASSYKYEGCTV